MANKEKLLASAQRNLEKGQLSRAIKDYKKIVKTDPGDVRSRQKLAELFGRAKMVKNSLEEYDLVAKYYSEGGFHLKAIAVYKKIQKLDPKRVEVFYRLAELNEKQGLIGNALAEYRNLIAYYEKEDRAHEILNVLKKMRDLDPENLSFRVKIAQIHIKLDEKERARQEFRDILDILNEKQDFPKIQKLFEVFLPLYPDDFEIQSSLGQVLIKKGDSEKGVRLLEELLKSKPDDHEILRALAVGYGSIADFEHESLTYQQLVEIFPDDFDLKEGYMRASLNNKDYNRAVEKLEEWKELFFANDSVDVLKGFYEKLNESLPKNEQVSRTLHRIYESTGERDKLFDIISSTPEGEPVSQGSPFAFPDEDPFSTPLSAEASEEPEEVLDLEELDAVDGATGHEGDAGGDEIEFGTVDDAFAELSKNKESADAAAEEFAPAAEASGTPQEISFDDWQDVDDLVEEIPFDEVQRNEVAKTSVSESSEEGGVAAPVEDTSVSLETEGFGDDFLTLDLDGLPGLEEVDDSGESDWDTEFEAADFFLQQELLDDAEQIFHKLLAARPDAEEVQQKLRDIEAKRQETALPENNEEYLDLALGITDSKSTVEDSQVLGLNKLDQFDLDDVFSGFKDEGDGQLGADDSESHYNLGIAYKEMGLMDDAIAEFEKAAQDSSRIVDCLTLKGICLAEKGDFEGAEKTLKEGLASSEMSETGRISLQYELGLIYEAWDRPLEAMESFRAVADVDLFFRDAKEKTKILRSKLGLDASEENGGDGKGEKDRISYV